MHQSVLEADVVGSAPLFRDVSASLADRLFSRRHASVFDEGEIIFQEGDPARSLMIVLEGTVKLVRVSEDGTETLLGLLGRGDTIAECALCARDRHNFSAEAVTRARILGIDAETVSACLSEESGFAGLLLRLQRRHLDTLMEQLEQMKRMTAAQRVGAFVMRQTRDRHGPARVTLPYEKSLIARLLGMNPESFSRALAKLRDVGMTVEGRVVSIAAVEKLRHYCRPD